MAQAVVDELEAIEIKEQDRDCLRTPPSPGEGMVDPIAEQATVREPGQRVGHGRLDQPIVDGGIL
jgi:hypothetical protein